MALDTLALLAAQYDDLADAEADYEYVKSLYYQLGLIDTFDAAVIARDEKGKVRIVHKHEQPTRQGAWSGLALGLATGAVVALFPAVALGAGLVWGGAIGSGAGALAGHAVAGMSRRDLMDLGELLDYGKAGLVVVAALDLESRVSEAITRASRVEKRRVTVDPDALAGGAGAAPAPA